MSRRSRMLRASLGALGAVALSASLAGCTLVSTLAGGGTSPTTTSSPTSSSTTTPSETQAAPPTSTSPATSNPTGDTMTDSRASLEEWLEEQYEYEYGVSATITCPGGSTIDIYVGLVIDCRVVESGGDTYTLSLTITEVDAADNSYSMRYQRY